jgi:DNA-binding XRE family transcriptional regulator
VVRLNPQILSKSGLLSLSLAEIESKQRKLAYTFTKNQQKSKINLSYFVSTYLMDKKRSDIGKAIQMARLEKGLTQEELSRKAEIPYTTLAKIESGMVVNPRMKTLQKIAHALNVTIDYLIKQTNNGNA